MNGWIKIHRRLLEWEHFGEPSVVTVYLALLLSAGKDGKTEIGLRGLASVTKLSTNTIRCAIAKLVESGEITRELNNGQKTVTTINNWSKYQVYQKLTHSKNDSVSKIDTPVYQKLTQGVSKIDTPHIINSKNNNKNNKEDIIVADAHARTHEEFLAEAMNELRVEQGCMALRISAQEYGQLVTDVVNDWQFQDLPENEWTLTHLLAQMRIKHNIKKREQNGTNRQPAAEGRAERAAKIAARMAALASQGASVDKPPF